MSSKKNREVTIIFRAYCKKDFVYDGVQYRKGWIITRLRNDAGKEYTVILRPHAVHSCNCAHVPSKKCRYCYHIELCRTRENARALARVQDEMQRLCVPVAPVADVPSPVVAPVVPARELASLGGTRTFSLMR